MIENQIAKKLTPIFEELEMALLENNLRIDKGLTGNPNYNNSALRATSKMFIDVMFDKLYVKEKDNMTKKALNDRVLQMGKEVRGLIKFYLDIDIKDLYKED